MKKLAFLYNMDLCFSLPAANHNFKLKCLPRTDDRQTVEKLSFELSPEADVSCGEDCFGNLTRYGTVYCEHTRFSASVKGICTIHGERGVPVNNNILGLFRLNTPLTAAGEALTGFYNEISLPDGDNLVKARYIMNEVYNHYEYIPKSTTTSTTAEQSFAMGKGVCQDYSQAMLSLCRLEGIPCRYVAGLLTGEGESHAWVEVEHNGLWFGFDPTNCVEVSDSHIVISTGRDSSDCSINRGVFRGGGTQTQQIYVKVEEIV